jgi:aminoglycoside phosphotransferase (APT) family kinase protein
VPEWDAEVVVSATEVAEIVGAQHPEFRNSRVVGYAEGWDNAAFLVDDTFVFRFPRRSIAVDLLTREIALLPLVSKFLALPISAPQYHGTWRGDLRWPFAGYRMLLGQSASLIHLDDDDRRRVAVPLGLFLRDLHAIETAPLVEAGLPPDLFRRFDVEKRLAPALARAEFAQAAGYDVPASVLRWFEDHPPILGDRRTVVHGDLYARHVMLDRGVLSGVIDWGDMHLGSPAIDLSAAHTMLPPEAHEIFRGAYGPISDEVWDAARWRGIYSALLCLEYGVTADAEDMRRCGSAALVLIARGL